MRRQDAKVGVEYAATAPLAYGREPRGHPRRVRFIDTRPGPWLRIVRMVYRQKAYGMTGSGWNTLEMRLVRVNSEEGREAERTLPPSMHAVLVLKYGRDEPYTRKSIGGTPRETIRTTIDHDAKRFGDEIEYVDDSIKGGLPGEVWRDGDHGWDWYATLIQPADIHRTWAEVEEEEHKRREAASGLDAEARIPEIRELVTKIGLNELMYVERLGSGVRVRMTSHSIDGDRLLADLTKWAADHGLIGTVKM